MTVPCEVLFKSWGGSILYLWNFLFVKNTNCWCCVYFCVISLKQNKVAVMLCSNLQSSTKNVALKLLIKLAVCLNYDFFPFSLK